MPDQIEAINPNVSRTPAARALEVKKFQEASPANGRARIKKGINAAPAEQVQLEDPKKNRVVQSDSAAPGTGAKDIDIDAQLRAMTEKVKAIQQNNETGLDPSAILQQRQQIDPSSFG